MRHVKKSMVILLGVLFIICFPLHSQANEDDVYFRNAVDITFVVDETVSMDDGFQAVQERTNHFVERLRSEGFDVQLSLVRYAEESFGCNSGLGWQGFTSDVQEFKGWVNAMETCYGPLENGAHAIEYAANKLEHEGREGIGKMIILLTDEPNDDYGYRQEAASLLDKNNIVLNSAVNEVESSLLQYLDGKSRGRYFQSDDHWDPFLQRVYDQILKQIGLNRSPNISSVEAEPSIVKIGNEVQVNMKASDPDGNDLNYKWEAVLPGGDVRLLGDSKNLSFKTDVAGVWTLHAVATDTWGEGVEKLINIRVIASDLTITEVNPVPPDSIHKGENMKIRAYIENIGNIQQTKPFDVELQVDGNPVTSVEHSDTGWVTLSYPFNHEQGKHKVEIAADANNDVLEENENNNARAYWVNVPNRQPEATFLWTPEEPIVDESNARVHSTSTDPDGDGLSYQWTYMSPNGESGSFGTSKEFRTLFKQTGEWEITLQVTDQYGSTDSETKTLTVYQNNTLDAQILHTKEWAEKREIFRSNVSFLAGEGFVAKAQTTNTAVSVTVIPPANLAKKAALNASDHHTEWKVKLTSKDIDNIVEGPYPWIFRATFDDGQVIQRPLLIRVTGKADPDIHLTQ